MTRLVKTCAFVVSAQNTVYLKACSRKYVSENSKLESLRKKLICPKTGATEAAPTNKLRQVTKVGRKLFSNHYIPNYIPSTSWFEKPCSFIFTRFSCQFNLFALHAKQDTSQPHNWLQTLPSKQLAKTLHFEVRTTRSKRKNWSHA